MSCQQVTCLQGVIELDPYNSRILSIWLNHIIARGIFHLHSFLQGIGNELPSDAVNVVPTTTYSKSHNRSLHLLTLPLLDRV